MITHSEAVMRRCSVKKVFLEISQNSQENTCARVSFILKERLWHKCFPVNFAKFLRSPFSFLIEHLWCLLLLLVISKFSQQVFTYWEWNMFKITNKKTRRTSLTLFWCLFWTLNILHVLLWCFPCWLWTSNCRLGNESYHINICIINVCIKFNFLSLCSLTK